MYLPKISIITPTLNSHKTIGDCLKSIGIQDYPKDKIEVIIADGGSVDGTVEIVKNAGISNLVIFENKLKTGEAGKAVGTKAAAGEIIAFIDSDNILPSVDWLRRMVESFSDPEIIASEPIEYTYRKTDGYITRYCALMGMNDPLCLFIGNYDRINVLSGRWTGLAHAETDMGSYLKIGFQKGILPTIGANGFFIRKAALDAYGAGDYLFDIDVMADILDKTNILKMAKVKVGIIHVFAGGVNDFVRKQNRRIRDYGYYKKLGLRKYKWNKTGLAGLLKFAIFSVLVFPLLAQALLGAAKKRDIAWFFHVPACVLTFYIYLFASLQNLFVLRPLSREGWQKR